MQWIIVPALERVKLDSPAARELLLGTAIQESGLKYVHQIQGPALGLFQMEPATHDDIWENFLKYKSFDGLGIRRAPEMLMGDLWYAAMMCRIHYYRVKEPLPEPGDLEGMAAYWKVHYNTYQGAGKPHDYIRNWHRAHKH
jgi:hypothetical protein